MPIVEAIGTAAVLRRSAYLSKRIEEAMAQAVRDALAEGIGLDQSDVIRARMMAAREHVKAQG